MEQIVNLVSEKVGISAEQSKQAVETVLGFLKDKLPEPVAGQIDGLLSGGGGTAGDLAKGASDLLGGD